MAGESYLFQQEGQALLSGVEMLIKGGLEAGVTQLIVGQIHGPQEAVDQLDTQRAELFEYGVLASVLPDAVQATAALIGADAAGQPGLLLLESSGVLESLGVFAQLRDRRLQAPVVIAIGPSDDAAGREALDMLRRWGLPIIEPAVHSEIQSWVDAAVQMSALSGQPVVLAMGAELWQGFATLRCRPNRWGDSPRPAQRIRSTQSAGQRESLWSVARDTELNTIVNPPGRDEALPFGLVASGVAYARLRQVLAELGLVGRLPILRLGLSSPLDGDLLARLARGCRRLEVVDCPDGPLFKQVVAGLGAAEQERVAALLPDNDPSPDAMVHALAPLLGEHPGIPKEVSQGAVARLLERIHGAQSASAACTVEISPREPTAPPGSALTDVAAVLGAMRRDLLDAQYMSEQHNVGPTDLAIFGQLDNASRGLLEMHGPMAHWSPLDGRIATASVFALQEDEGIKPVVFMSGRSFFAAGQAMIAQAARAGRDVVFVVHTEAPPLPRKRLRLRRKLRHRHRRGVLDMQAMVESLSSACPDGTLMVGAIDTADRSRLWRLLERAVTGKGVRVVLARRQRGRRYYSQRMRRLTQESVQQGYVAGGSYLVHCPEAGGLTAEHRLQLGPLGIQMDPTPDSAWGISVSRAWTDETVFRALADPSVGLMTILRNGPERSRLDEQQLDPMAALPTPRHAQQEVWRASVAGISGAGFGTLLKLLSHAGEAMGYDVRSDRWPGHLDSGQAAVGHLLFESRPDPQAVTVAGAPGRTARPTYAVTPTSGGVDLLLGAELTESVRLISQGACVSLQRTGVIIDELVVPMCQSLAQGEPSPTQAWIDVIKPEHRQAPVSTAPFADLSEWLWGHTRYAAWMMIGCAMQQGLIPVTRQAVEAATHRVLGASDPRCEQAFDVGRKLAVAPDFAADCLAEPARQVDELLEARADDLAEQFGPRRGPALSREWSSEVAALLEKAQGCQDATAREIIETAYRCAVWGWAGQGVEYTRRMCGVMAQVMAQDAEPRGYELTRITLAGVQRAMLVPDEPYLAALLTSPQRYRRDRRRLNLALERGDQASYKHMFRPEIELFKRRMGFTVVLGDRMLKLLSRSQFVRRLRAGWYRESREFRDAYLLSLENLICSGTDADYRRCCELASTALSILGRAETSRAAVREAGARLEKRLATDPHELHTT